MLGNFFSHRTHRLNRTFLHTISNSQKASGIQISQNVTANVWGDVCMPEAFCEFETVRKEALLTEWEDGR